MNIVYNIQYLNKEMKCINIAIKDISLIKEIISDVHHEASLSIKRLEVKDNN